MTLNITIVTERSAWQSSDFRLTYWPSGAVADDWSDKHLSLKCPDGSALITYTGIGRFDNIAVTDWLANRLDGETRTVQESIDLIIQETTVKVASMAPGHLIISVAAFQNDKARALQITNVEDGPAGFSQPPRPDFRMVDYSVNGHVVLLTGGGAAGISDIDRNLLVTEIAGEKKGVEELLALIAEVNQRAASHPVYGQTVSPACFVTHMPPTGGVRGKLFARGQKHPVSKLAIRHILYGFNFTPFSVSLVENSDIFK